MTLRNRAVSAIKTNAIKVTRRSPRGSAFFLRVYLEAEEHAEQPLLDEVLGAAEIPDWLRRQLERHQRDEQRHARLLKVRLRELGQSEARVSGRFDLIGRWKVAQLRSIVSRHKHRFAAGELAVILAIAWRMEQMGVRVLERHAAALPDSDPTKALVARIGREERGHAVGCRRALDRLVSEGEAASLDAVIEDVDRVERAFGVSGAIAMWLGSVAQAAAGVIR